MNRLLAALCTLPLLVGCAAVPPPVPKPVGIVVDEPTWAMTVPEGWVVNKDEDGVIATNPHAPGQPPELAVIVANQSLTEGKEQLADQEFGAMVVLLTTLSGRVEVLNVQTGQVAGHPGATLLIKAGNVTLLQHAVGVNGRGYLINCGGPAGVTIMKPCHDILSTFHFKQ